MFGVGSLGPRWMPQGFRGAGPLSGSSGRWGALGKAERAPGGRQGLRTRPLCVLGNAREPQLQPALKVARLHASRHPGGRSGTSPTGRGGRSAGGARAPGRVLPPPAGAPAGLGCAAQGCGGAAGPLKWQRGPCVSQPARLQLLGAMEDWCPDGCPKICEAGRNFEDI